VALKKIYEKYFYFFLHVVVSSESGIINSSAENFHKKD
jgi:hypothetical protein